MTPSLNWPKITVAQVLNTLIKTQKVLIGLVTIGLGLLIGYLNVISAETAALTVSVIVIFVLLLVIIDRPLHGFLLLLVLIAFLEEWVEIPMGAGIPDLSFSRFVIPFLTIFMLARAAIGEFKFASPLVGLTEIAIIVTSIGLVSASSMSSNPTLEMQRLISWYCMPLMIYFLARHLIQSKQDLHKLFWAIVIFGFAAAVYAIYEFTTGHILFLAKDQDVSQLLTSYSSNLRLLRGLLERSGNFARVFLSTIPVTFYLLFEQKSIGRKLLLAAIVVIQFYGMFITYNRTSWYALMIGLFLLQFFYPQFRKVYLVMLIFSVLILAATWNQVNESAIISERVNSKVSTLDDREARWEAGYNMWQARPVRGWGFDAYQNESGRFRTDGQQWNFNAIENDFLYIMVGSGLIGFVPYLVFLLAPLVNSLRLFFKARVPDWGGFVKPETIAIYWVSTLCFAIGSYTQVQNIPIVKMIPFAMAGAIIGTHQHWLRRIKEKA